MAEFENSGRELLDALLDALLALPQSHAQIERYEVEIGPRGQADALIGAFINRQPLLLLVRRIFRPRRLALYSGQKGIYISR